MTSGFLKECEECFHTKDLYQVLGVKKESSGNEIRKGFYKLSLIYHPDHHKEDKKLEATVRFQVLSKVYSILSDVEQRKIYDETGIVDDSGELSDKSYDDWVAYWNLLFPRITTEQIDHFYTEYRGSKQETDDLITIYNRCEGDMDVIMETLLFSSHDEEGRIRSLLDKLIKQGRIKVHEKYVNECPKKAADRYKRALKEEKLFAREEKRKKTPDNKKGDNINDLVAMIKTKHQQAAEMSDVFLDKLAEKYCNKRNSKKRNSRVSKK